MAQRRRRRDRVWLSKLTIALVLGGAVATWQTTVTHDHSKAPVPAQAVAAAVDQAGDGQWNNQDNLPARVPFAPPPTPQPPIASVPPATGTVPVPVAPPRIAPGASWGGAGFPRGAYVTGFSATAYSRIAGARFNSIMGSHYREELDAAAALGLKTVVWLGSWSNSSCSFKWGDDQVRSAITPVRGHPAILAYYLGDEPLFGSCPSSPQTYEARSALVHSLDPGRPTFTVIQAWDPGAHESFPYRHFAQAVDILGLDVYPCARNKQVCDFAQIDAAVAAAEAAGIKNYWGVLQAFEDDYYRMPTPAEIATQFEHWQRSRMSGYFVFSWDYLGSNLEAHPAVVSELARWNAR
jgi:hypothetical protein